MCLYLCSVRLCFASVLACLPLLLLLIKIHYSFILCNGNAAANILPCTVTSPEGHSLTVKTASTVFFSFFSIFRVVSVSKFTSLQKLINHFLVHYFFPLLKNRNCAFQQHDSVQRLPSCMSPPHCSGPILGSTLVLKLCNMSSSNLSKFELISSAKKSSPWHESVTCHSG